MSLVREDGQYVFNKNWKQELEDMRDDHWRKVIKHCISESREGYGVIDPVKLEEYLEMAIGEDDGK